MIEGNYQRTRAGRPTEKMDGYPSGQRGLTVNQMAGAFGGSNPSPSTTDRACGLCMAARIAQLVERVLGKNEVMGSNPIAGSCRNLKKRSVEIKEI
jgi:hypothetical protein